MNEAKMLQALRAAQPYVKAAWSKILCEIGSYSEAALNKVTNESTFKNIQNAKTLVDEVLNEASTASETRPKLDRMTEEQGYCIEAALQHGFTATDDDATEFSCTDAQICSLLKIHRDLTKQLIERLCRINDIIYAAGAPLGTSNYLEIRKLATNLPGSDGYKRIPEHTVRGTIKQCQDVREPGWYWEIEEERMVEVAQYGQVFRYLEHGEDEIKSSGHHFIGPITGLTREDMLQDPIIPQPAPLKKGL